MTVQGTLIVLRHGQTDYNKQRLMTGQRDVPLTALGEEQAREAGALIKHIHIDKAYSSPLSRAFNTASLALKAAGQTVTIEKRAAIIEADAGQFAGRNIDTDPDILAFGRVYAIPMPGGESDKDVVARVQKFYDEEVLPALARGENIMLVCHSGTMHALDVVLGLMKPPTDDQQLVTRRIPNASPLVCEYEDGVMKNHYFITNPKAPAPANQNNAAKKNPNKYRPEF